MKDPATEPICPFTISVMTSLSLGELVVLIYDLGGRDLYLYVMKKSAAHCNKPRAKKSYFIRFFNILLLSGVSPFLWRTINA